MLPGFEVDLVTSPRWPGFNARGALVLPLPAFPANALPATCEIDDVALQRKSEFHLTLLSQSEVRSVREQFEDGAIESIFAGMDWSCRTSGPCWLLRKVDQKGAIAHTVIALCAAPALNVFRSRLSGRSDIALAPVPAHVTLFVAGNELGIGLSSYDEFHAARVRLVAESVLDRGIVRE
jgi:hypothetical protein